MGRCDVLDAPAQDWLKAPSVTASHILIGDLPTSAPLLDDMEHPWSYSVNSLHSKLSLGPPITRTLNTQQLAEEEVANMIAAARFAANMTAEEEAICSGLDELS